MPYPTIYQRDWSENRCRQTRDGGADEWEAGGSGIAKGGDTTTSQGGQRLRADDNGKRREKAADNNGCLGKEGIMMTAGDERRCMGGRRLRIIIA